MIDYRAAREAMVDRQVRPADVTRHAIIDAMLEIPRERFLPKARRPVAYAETMIDLGGGRAVIDPRSFAKMLDAVDMTRRDQVLDIGCGYGYSTAVMARIAESVVALESDPMMIEQATALLNELGAHNASVVEGPLNEGAPGNGPYDVIMIAGGVAELPKSLYDQLKPGGRLVAVFMDGAYGQARVATRSASGVTQRRAFDAAAPIVPGFEKAPEFAF